MTDLVRSLLARGWGELLAPHGFDPDRPGAPLRVDRAAPGFEDFAGDRAIEPGHPELSLLYHAVASPAVRLPPGSGYASLEELTRLEDGIHALDAPPVVTGLAAVFAYEYRPAARTAHGQHADFVFSRTGVARVGSSPPRWDAERRCFTGAGLSALPARYGVFLVDPVDVSGLAVLGAPAPGDPSRVFLRPGRKLTGAFRERHRSERLHRAVTVGGLALADGFDAGALVREEGLVDLVPIGASALVCPVPGELVRLAWQRNAVSGRDEVVRFRVPPERDWVQWAQEGPNRRYTSLRLPHRFFVDIADSLTPEGELRQQATAYRTPRNGPVYVNIRHEVLADGVTVVHLGESTPGFERRVDAGGYFAAMFEDGVCDGCVEAEVPGITVLPAWSLVCAPDFLPLADGTDLAHLPDHFLNGGPQPLCEGRQPANPEMVPASIAADTVVAVVSRNAMAGETPAPRDSGPEPTPRDRGAPRATSTLPDGASNVFAPGWDVTYAGDDSGVFYATYGLGSPFLEDVKLCAAANGMWPAASPDAARTFQGALQWTFRTPTAIPLLDPELGHHPGSPAVRDHGLAPSRGWDGEHGPFLVRDESGVHVDFADIGRADYVANARAGLLDGSVLAGVDSTELIARMDALRTCIARLPTPERRVSRTGLWLVTATTADFDRSWTATGIPLDLYERLDPPAMAGGGFVYGFAATTGEHALVAATSRRRRMPCTHVYVCLVTASELRWTDDGVTWHREDPA